MAAVVLAATVLISTPVSETGVLPEQLKTWTPIPVKTPTPTRTKLPTPTRTRTPTPTRTPVPTSTRFVPQPHLLYFPVSHRSGRFPPIFTREYRVGVYVTRFFANTPRFQTLVLKSKVQFIDIQYESGVNPDIWELLQPVGPNQPYQWGNAHFQDFEKIYNWTRDNRIAMQAHLTGAPAWARTGENRCTPVKPEYWDAYTNVLNALIKRYPGIKWYIWNEPDVKSGQPPVLQPDIFFQLYDASYNPDYLLVYGCWGHTPLEYWKFFDHVRRRAWADVYHGGLMAGTKKQWDDFMTPAFANRIDIGTEHAYHNYRYVLPEGGWTSTWDTNKCPNCGIIPKTAYIRSVIPADIFLYVNETNGVWPNPNVNRGDECRQIWAGQAEYFKLLRTIKTISGYTAFALNSDWRCTNLYDWNLPGPAPSFIELAKQNGGSLP